MFIRDPYQLTAESYFKDINGMLGLMFSAACLGVMAHQGVAWAGLVLYSFLAYWKGDEYRRIVDSYLRPHKNWKAFKLMLSKALPFTVGVTLMSIVALELITFSNGAFVFG